MTIHSFTLRGWRVYAGVGEESPDVCCSWRSERSKGAHRWADGAQCTAGVGEHAATTARIARNVRFTAAHLHVWSQHWTRHAHTEELTTSFAFSRFPRQFPAVTISKFFERMLIVWLHVCRPVLSDITICRREAHISVLDYIAQYFYRQH